MILNLGCGNDFRYNKDWVNMDLTMPCSVMADLREGLPFKTSSADGVWASHILEHVQDLRALKIELARIIRGGGDLQIIVPHFSSPDAYGDDTHCRFFSFHSFWNQYWPGFNLVDVHKKALKQSNPLVEEECSYWIFATLRRNTATLDDVCKQLAPDWYCKAGVA